MELTAENPSALPAIARKLLEFAGGDVFFIFNGPMGAGKTTFIKAFCEELGVGEVVTSPTFSIVNEYTAQNGPAYHFDFYRIKGPQEAYDIGYEEYFYSGNYCLVEWPEKVRELLPQNHIRVDIAPGDNDLRKISFTRVG